MILRKLLVCMLVLLAISGYSQKKKYQQITLNASKGAHLETYMLLNEFQYDDSIKVISLHKHENLKHYLLFRDTIVYSGFYQDNSFYDEESVLKFEYSDSLKLPSFLTYFKNKYQTTPDFRSMPDGFITYLEGFGIACGASGAPTASGKVFLKHIDSKGDEDLTKKLLLSFDPQERLVGLILQRKFRFAGCETNYDLLENSRYLYNVCSGCEGPRKYTYKEMLADQSNIFWTVKID